MYYNAECKFAWKNYNPNQINLAYITKSGFRKKLGFRARFSIGILFKPSD